jgi:hypothetical protein
MYQDDQIMEDEVGGMWGGDEKRVKWKSKIVPLRHAGDKGRGYSCYSFSTSALVGVSGQYHAPPRFTTGIYRRYPLDRRLIGYQNWCWHRLEEKSFASAGDRPPAVQSVVRHYTNWATVARRLQNVDYKANGKRIRKIRSRCEGNIKISIR